MGLRGVDNSASSPVSTLSEEVSDVDNAKGVDRATKAKFSNLSYELALLKIDNSKIYKTMAQQQMAQLQEVSAKREKTVNALVGLRSGHPTEFDVYNELGINSNYSDKDSDKARKQKDLVLLQQRVDTYNDQSNKILVQLQDNMNKAQSCIAKAYSFVDKSLNSIEEIISTMKK